MIEECSDLISWFQNGVDCLSSQDAVTRFFCGWHIWKRRNNFIFQEELLHPSSTAYIIKSEVSDWISSLTKALSCPPSQPRDHPQHPDPLPRIYDKVILCDASFKSDVRKAGIGIIVKNAEGQIVDDLVENIPCRNPISAEAAALSIAASLASSFQGRACIISDCKTLVEALSKNQTEWPISCSATIASIRKLMNSSGCHIIFRRRTETLEADWLARSSCNNTLPRDWRSVIGL
ncbi:hypothetical protein LINPERPRIM_LOCUS36833 [Linum perenne]